MKVAMKIVSKSYTVIHLTREVRDEKDAIDTAFEESCSEPYNIATIDLENITDMEEEEGSRGTET